MPTRHKLEVSVHPLSSTEHVCAHVGVRWWGSGRRRKRGSGRYNPGMTHTDAPDSTPSNSDYSDIQHPGGLTDADHARIAAAHAAARTASTRTVYGFAWRQWERWCADRGVRAARRPGRGVRLPHRPGRRTASPSPPSTSPAPPSGTPTAATASRTRSPTKRSGRSARAAPHLRHRAPPQARPLSVPELRQMSTTSTAPRPIGVRDTAVILLGFAGALRRSELAALTLADLEHQPAGLLLTIRRSKTDQYARGQVVAIAHGQHAVTDPIAALDAWLAHRGRQPGPLFTRVYATRIHAEPITGNTITRMLHARAAAAGLPAERITAHSLRAGHATTAALAGVALERIAAQTRHRDISVLVERYIRPLDALATTSSRDLGL